jgi:hypothetical protein
MRPMQLMGAGVLAVLSAAAVAAPPPVSADDDRKEMMRQLGITALVPGANGDEKAPDAANIDESKANPYPLLPDPLTLKSGGKVTSAKIWRDKRRPEILEDYAREVYGRVPAGLPPVQWKVVATDREMIGFSTPVIARRVIGHVENPANPAKSVDIRLMEVLPAGAKGRVPVLIMFKYGADAFPEPSQPTTAEYDRINAAFKALLVRQDPSLGPVFEAHQALSFAAAPGFRFPQRDANGDLPPPDQLIAAG